MEDEFGFMLLKYAYGNHMEPFEFIYALNLFLATCRFQQSSYSFFISNYARSHITCNLSGNIVHIIIVNRVEILLSQ